MAMDNSIIDLHINRRIFNDVYFDDLYDYSFRYQVFYGGAGSGKSHYVFQKIVIKALRDKRKVLVIRKVARTLKDSCFQMVIDTLSRFQLLSQCKVNNTTFTIELPNGSSFLFKGLDDSEKIKSIAGLTDIVIEEATEITEEEFTQLDLRMRAKAENQQIYLMFNPVSKVNWCYKYWFENGPPDNTKIIKTTYKDNRFLPPDYIASLENMKKTNFTYWSIYANGEFCSLDKLIFTNWDYGEYEKQAQDVLILGLDFGYVNDASAFIAAYVRESTKEIFIVDEHYEKGLLNNQIAAMIKYKGYAKEVIIADSAEQKSIEEIKREGIPRIKPATKGQGSVLQGIQKLQQYKLIVSPKCENTIIELQNYSWVKDKKSGEYTNEPQDTYNHCIDEGMYKISADRELTPNMILKYIEANRAEEARRANLYNYYIGNHSIKHRTLADATKPNNKVVNPYANYITDTYVGYFMGEPISYNSADEALLADLQAINNYNDEAAENAELAKDASIFGVAYELMFLDEDRNVRFKKLEPTRAIAIYSDTLNEDLLYFIRYYDDLDIESGDTTTYIEVYSSTYIRTYKKDASNISFIEEKEHFFKDVPIIIYQNNPEQLGDFEPVVPLIDAYDKLESDSVNDMEYFADAYLALIGMEGTEAEDVAAMKEQRVILLSAGASAQWLTKNVNDTYIENLKTRLDNSIHKFSKCPAMTDKDFAANASGVAMKYKLMGIETSTSKKERAFKKGLQRRIELICNYFYLIGVSYDYRAVNFSFKRNIPANLVEIAEVLTKVGYLLSEETQVGLLPVDIDYEAEKARKAEEKQAGYSIDFNTDTTTEQ